MFKIEFYADDKRLGEALRALVGLAHGAPSVTPMTNVVAGANGKIAARTGGKMLDIFAEHLKTSGDLAPNEIKKLCVSNGFATSSYSRAIALATDAGLIKQVKVPGYKSKFVYRPTAKAKQHRLPPREGGEA